MEKAFGLSEEVADKITGPLGAVLSSSGGEGPKTTYAGSEVPPAGYMDNVKMDIAVDKAIEQTINGEKPQGLKAPDRIKVNDATVVKPVNSSIDNGSRNNDSNTKNTETKVSNSSSN